jgi:hypothetical protein
MGVSFVRGKCSVFSAQCSVKHLKLNTENCKLPPTNKKTLPHRAGRLLFFVAISGPTRVVVGE